MKSCEICSKPRGTTGCTNGRCAKCHYEYCGTGGSESPGHGKGKRCIDKDCPNYVATGAGTDYCETCINEDSGP